MVYGFRNRNHLKIDSYFPYVGLDLYPDTHSKPERVIKENPLCHTFTFATNSIKGRIYVQLVRQLISEWLDYTITKSLCQELFLSCHLQIKTAPFLRGFHFKSALLIFAGSLWGQALDIWISVMIVI